MSRSYKKNPIIKISTRGMKGHANTEDWGADMSYWEWYKMYKRK